MAWRIIKLSLMRYNYDYDNNYKEWYAIQLDALLQFGDVF